MDSAYEIIKDASVEFLKNYLIGHGFNGLAGNNCGCGIDDLCPCGNEPDQWYECYPANKIYCIGCVEPGCDWREKNEGCWQPVEPERVDVPNQDEGGIPHMPEREKEVEGGK